MSRFPSIEEANRGSDLSKLAVDVGEPNSRGYSEVRMKYRQQTFTDRIDCTSAYFREKCIDSAINTLGLTAPPSFYGDGGAGRLRREVEDKLMAAVALQMNGAAFLSDIVIQSAVDLVRDNPTLNPVVVDGLLREGETANLISNPKVGKSWMAYSLELSVADGIEWLGRFRTAQGRVLHIDNELHAATLAHRYPTVAECMGLNWSDVATNIDIITLRGDLKSIADLERTFGNIDPGTYRLVVLDAKYRAILPGTSENDNAAEAAFYNLVDRYAAMTQAAFVLIHHATKGSQSDKRTTDVGAGAGAQSRAADAHIAIREHEEEGVFVLDAAVRSFAPVKPVALRWEFPLWVPTLDVDPAKLKGRLTTSEQRTNDRDRDGINKIVDVLRQGPATVREVRRKTALSKDRAERLLDRLEADEAVTASSIVVRGNPTRQYTLAEPDVVD